MSGIINIGTDQGWLYIENSYKDDEILEIDKLFEVKFDLNKENSNGLGLSLIHILFIRLYDRAFDRRGRGGGAGLQQDAVCQ